MEEEGGLRAEPIALQAHCQGVGITLMEELAMRAAVNFTLAKDHGGVCSAVFGWDYWSPFLVSPSLHNP